MTSTSVIVASAFIGAISTGIVTLLVREVREELNTQRRRERFRDSLIGEIDAGMYNAGSAEIITQVGGGMMPTSVFDTDTTKLGLLTEEEIKVVTGYYASADKINALGERVSLNPDRAVDEDSMKETAIAEAYYTERERVLENGREAIDKLRENKSETGVQYIFQ